MTRPFRIFFLSAVNASIIYSFGWRYFLAILFGWFACRFYDHYLYRRREAGTTAWKRHIDSIGE